MTLPRAALYTEAHALARELLTRTARFPKQQRFVLAARIESGALDLLDALGLAVLEAEDRPRRLRRADAALHRIRFSVRLAADLGHITAGVADDIQRRLDALGRRVGGWRRGQAEASPSGADRLRVTEDPRAGVAGGRLAQ